MHAVGHTVQDKWSTIWNSPGVISFRSEVKAFYLECLKRTYAVSLIALFICGLSEISLLNSIYIVFFLVFILFPKLLPTLWPYLIAYTALVLFSLFMWQISWTIPYDCSIVGLRHYSSFSHPNAVWHFPFLLSSVFFFIIFFTFWQENPCYQCTNEENCIWDFWTGVFWNVVIFITSVLQLIIQRQVEKIEKKLEIAEHEEVKNGEVEEIPNEIGCFPSTNLHITFTFSNFPWFFFVKYFQLHHLHFYEKQIRLKHQKVVLWI